MSKINKILVPVEGSDNACKAVDQAISLAEKAGHLLNSFTFLVISMNIFLVISSLIVSGKNFQKILCNKTCRNRLSSKSYYSCSSRN